MGGKCRREDESSESTVRKLYTVIVLTSHDGFCAFLNAAQLDSHIGIRSASLVLRNQALRTHNSNSHLSTPLRSAVQNTLLHLSQTLTVHPFVQSEHIANQLENLRSIVNSSNHAVPHCLDNGVRLVLGS